MENDIHVFVLLFTGKEKRDGKQAEAENMNRTSHKSVVTSGRTKPWKDGKRQHNPSPEGYRETKSWLIPMQPKRISTTCTRIQSNKVFGDSKSSD